MVKVIDGKITDIVWDNGCFDCNETLCDKSNVTSINPQKSNDTVKFENCVLENLGESCPKEVTEGNYTACEPKFYVTWFGSDVNGRQMKSSNLAMSKFKQYSIGSLVSSVKNIFG